MIYPVNSPILQDKYDWQKQEYKLTKDMSTIEYLKFVQKRADDYLMQKGFNKQKVGSDAYRLEKA